MMDVGQGRNAARQPGSNLPTASRRAQRETVLNGRGRGGSDHPYGPAVSTPPPQWATSSLDYRAHVLRGEGPDPLGLAVALCGHRLLCNTPGTDEPQVGRCGSCEFIRRYPGAVWPDPGRFRSHRPTTLISDRWPR